MPKVWQQLPECLRDGGWSAGATASLPCARPKFVSWARKELVWNGLATFGVLSPIVTFEHSCFIKPVVVARPLRLCSAIIIFASNHVAALQVPTPAERRAKAQLRPDRGDNSGHIPCAATAAIASASATAPCARRRSRLLCKGSGGGRTALLSLRTVVLLRAVLDCSSSNLPVDSVKVVVAALALDCGPSAPTPAAGARVAGSVNGVAAGFSTT